MMLLNRIEWYGSNRNPKNSIDDWGTKPRIGQVPTTDLWG